LAGPSDLIEQAFRLKHRLGGAMRQAGVLAAAAVYALDHHVDRLADDHARARRLAAGLAELEAVTIDVEKIESNIVIFEVPDAEALVRALAANDVRMGALDARRVRAVTHLDVDDAGIERALAAARQALGP
jgi:threonine aldolase